MPMLEMPMARSEPLGDLERKWVAIAGAQWPPLRVPVSVDQLDEGAERERSY